MSSGLGITAFSPTGPYDTRLNLGWTRPTGPRSSCHQNTWLLFLIYGIYAAATEGIARAFVTDLVPHSLRGSALGWFGGVTGLAALPANILAGWLWVAGGPSATFWFGAFMAALSLALMVAWLPWLRRGFSERRAKSA